jgi:hypothetical protein
MLGNIFTRTIALEKYSVKSEPFTSIPIKFLLFFSFHFIKHLDPNYSNLLYCIFD